MVAGGAGRLGVRGVVSGYAVAAAGCSLVACERGRSSERVQFARGAVRRALPGMLRLVPRCLHARVRRLGRQTAKGCKGP